MTIIALGDPRDFAQHRADQDLHWAATRQGQIMTEGEDCPLHTAVSSAGGMFTLKHYFPCNRLFCYVITS